MPIDPAPLTSEQRETLKTLNISDSIRYLDAEGFPRAEIARILGKRYQHVRNVLVRSTESGVRRKTLKFAVRAKTIEEFRMHCKMLGRLPDRYLNQVLTHGLEELSERKPNSVETESMLVELYRDDFAFSDATEAVKLESPLVERIHEECARMHLPVDLFVTASLETANLAAQRSLELVDYPFEYCQGKGFDFLANYVMTDEEVQRLQARRVDDERLIEAIAQIKDISIGAAANSVVKLSRAQIETMKTNPDIRDIMHRLNSEEDTPVSLDDLLA